jgi:aspartyl-tRNA(Asn)/glutamyl-tRNA(Gln) amidotransferase subunit A
VNGYLTISDAAAALRTGEVTSVQLVENAIAVSDAVEGDVGSFLKRFVDESLVAAKAADEQLASGAEVGPLHGIPLGIKDIITTSEAPSTAQSLILDPAWSHGDAEVVSRLRGAGGIVMGKMTTMEFAVGMPDPTKPFPIPKNPWHLEHWAGGSSSGSGSAVATGAVMGALGTDTGGSIRIPAAFCGITGLMQTFGRVPKSGCVPLGYSLDHIGPMARSARDCALMLSVLAGHHPSDLSSIDLPVPDYLSPLTGDLTGLTIGVDRLTRFCDGDDDPALGGVLDATLGELEALGATVVDLELPFYVEATAALGAIAGGEMLAYHLPDAQVRLADYVESNRIGLGTRTFYTGADYVQSQRVRRVVQRALAQVYERVDLVLTPTSSVPAMRLDELTPDLSWFRLIHTPYWDITGNPVMSLPAGFNGDGMPLAVQLAGRPFDEVSVLRAGDAYQRVTNWHLQRPALGATSVAA